MALILNIDCATEVALVGISNNADIVIEKENTIAKEHASFMQVALQQLFSESGIAMHQLDAVAVTNGPGSYTGLRVGLATAKGICYALNKPLITLNTLEVMTHAAISKMQNSKNLVNDDLFCPMIDARRMEVFTGIYNKDLKVILDPCAIEITNTSFSKELENRQMYFFGSGSNKCKTVLSALESAFLHVDHQIVDIAILAKKAFDFKEFANVAYAEPLYLKEFHSTQKSHS